MIYLNLHARCRRPARAQPAFAGQIHATGHGDFCQAVALPDEVYAQPETDRLFFSKIVE